MNVHLVDGTWELFRHHFGAPAALDAAGRPAGAVRGVVASLLGMLERGATHVAVATDHVIESFRNDLWPGYKTGAGIDPVLLAQFRPLEEALRSLGVQVWAMEELEADDGLASGAARAARDPRVERVYICTPDKDLSQCVAGERVVQWDRRRDEIRDERGVVAKFGVPPASIPDYLALVGDSADGFPGVPGWGPKSTSTVLGRYGHLEHIPGRPDRWDVAVRGAKRLAASLAANRSAALLFRDLATLRDGAAVFDRVDELEWTGPDPGFRDFAADIGVSGFWKRAVRLRESRFGTGDMST
ncbi:MAG: flap endonuclease [Gemmatimonadota bacterium]|nr:flap endonuclease [Gemmatimonadota bacterium]MDE2871089.1 flap endonuclease [Gemmatimonadota bacterium]